MPIKILLTGGTIDKHYNESNGKLDFVDTHIPDLLKLGRNKAIVTIETLMLKDSLEMEDADRLQIAASCQETNEQKIIITHGTDTMVETARCLAQDDLPKTIVLIGAMVPFVFKHSDAMFNMGFAMAAVQTLPQGVYIAMNGKVFNWHEVTKNRKLGVFESS